VTGWAAYVAGVLWALQKAGGSLPGVDLAVDSDVPVGAGLASSAALECGVAVAMDDLAGLALDRLELARVAQRAEAEYVGVPCGVMDQVVALCGREDHALLLDTRIMKLTPIRCDPSAAGLTLLVIDTQVRHALADGAYATRRRECEAAAAALGVPALRDADPGDLVRLADPVLARRARHVVTENARVLAAVEALRDEAWDELGALFIASHESLQRDFEVSVPELDLVVETTLSHGALGARLTGAGFGGSAVALVPTPAVGDVSAACAEAFAARHLPAPRTFAVVPSAGAGPLED
jgi:galactokinase